MGFRDLITFFGCIHAKALGVLRMRAFHSSLREMQRDDVCGCVGGRFSFFFWVVKINGDHHHMWDGGFLWGVWGGWGRPIVYCAVRMEKGSLRNLILLVNGLNAFDIMRGIVLRKCCFFDMEITLRCFSFECGMFFLAFSFALLCVLRTDAYGILCCK